MSITPMFASSPDAFVMLIAFVGPFFVIGFALITLIVNAKWGRGRFWGFILGTLALACGGTDLGILLYWGERWGVLFWAAVCSIVVALSGLYLWGRRGPENSGKTEISAQPSDSTAFPN